MRESFGQSRARIGSGHEDEDDRDLPPLPVEDKDGSFRIFIAESDYERMVPSFQWAAVGCFKGASAKGVVISGMVLLVTFWGIQKRGPLFVSVFNPLSVIIVALFGSVFLEEPLHLGSVLGTGLIIMGLYTVLWGKGKEMKELHRLPMQKPATEQAAKPGLDGVHSEPPGGMLEESRHEEKDVIDQFAGGLQSIHGSL